MLRARTRWLRRFSAGGNGQTVASTASLHPIIDSLLVARGIDTPEKMAAFLHPSREQLGDPFGLKGMAEAVALIQEAVQAGHRIAVYGDYDADGVTSTALMVRTLRYLGADAEVYIPDRFREGYGLNADAVRQLAERGVRLLITVDTGISSKEEVALAKGFGMKVIVTDHHEPPPELPEADSVINPKQPGCPYPFKSLAGVGVAFKVAQALLSDVPPELWQLAAVGTISDLMPLVEENRVLASIGLAEMNSRPLPGIRALGKQARIRGLWDSEAVGFFLGPRLNAAGRLAHAMGAYRLLMAEDETAAEEDAAWLEQLNRRRQQLVVEVSEAAQRQLVQLDAQNGRQPGTAPVYVLAGRDWHEGVLGIAAARLVEKFHRPFVLLAIDEESGKAKGSARGVPGLDLYETVAACGQWLDKFGGHAQAAGMTLPAANIEPFRQALAAEVEARWSGESRQPFTEVELYAPLEAVDFTLWEALQRLEPYGVGNPKPVIYFGAVDIEQVVQLGKKQEHVKLFLRAQNSRMVEAVGFQCPDWAERIAPGSIAHIIGQIGVNEWNGTRKLQIFLQDVSIPHRQVFDWRRTPEKVSQWRMRAADHEAAGDVDPDEALVEAMEADGAESIAPGLTVGMEDAPANATVFFLSFLPHNRGIPEVFNGLLPAEFIHKFFNNANGHIRFSGWPLAPDAQADAVTDLVLLDVPLGERQLAEVLQRFSAVERLYCVFQPEAGMAVPERGQFAALFRWMREAGRFDEMRAAQAGTHFGLAAAQTALILRVFRELGFLVSVSEGYELRETGRSRLENSMAYLEAKQRQQMGEFLHRLTTRDLQQYIFNLWTQQGGITGHES